MFDELNFQPIPVHISKHRHPTVMSQKINKHNNITVKRSKKLEQALDLPVVLNVNPRSVYNKISQFQTFVLQHEIDVVCMSESWEREELTLEEVIKLDNYEIISNVHQRKGVGGRPAIIANNKKYHVRNITKTLNIPWGVEAVWCMITPKNLSNSSIVKKIAVASIYSKPDSRKKSALLDHISETFAMLSSSYKDGLYFIICGDVNEMKIDSILHLSPNMKQVVQGVTRLDPPRMLDPIITTLSKYYQIPECLPPLDPDPDSNGSPADHLMVEMKPISAINNKPARMKRTVKFRPLSESGIAQFREWLKGQSWEEIYSASDVHQKAKILQETLLEALNNFLPEKSVTFSSDDQPWMTAELKELDRKRKREFKRHRKSERWQHLNEKFCLKLNLAKENYYTNMIQDLKESEPGQWYSKLKRMASVNQKTEPVEVEELFDLDNEAQAEKIADRFEKISNRYEALENDDVKLPNIPPASTPNFTVKNVKSAILSLKTKTSTVPGDIPAKVLKATAGLIAVPLAHIINSSLIRGEYPDVWKKETVTPVPKVFPPSDCSQLRKISVFLNLSKVAEKLLSELIIKDMESHFDSTQFGNQKKTGVQHYLLKLIHKVLFTLDNNSKGEILAVIASLYDWKQAFDLQCPKLGLESFKRNGVRPALLPLLRNYFQKRKMVVKWHGKMSSERDLNGGGPQGGHFGILEYLSQTNKNLNFVDQDLGFKFFDDASVLEIVNLLNIGLASHNFKAWVPSHIPTHNQFIPPESLKSQQYLKEIVNWSQNQKMELNVEKSNIMVFNFTHNHQFTTQIGYREQTVQIVDEKKLLGTIVTSDLKWHKNSQYLVKKAYARMQILHKISEFGAPIEDMLTIYISYVRSILEQSCVIWHSSLTEEDSELLERVQKCALKIILKNSYTTYEEALEKLMLAKLSDRREKLMLKFAKNCTQNKFTSELFPLNKTTAMKTRHRETYKVMHCNTDRLKDSAVPYMQRLLNKCS